VWQALTDPAKFSEWFDPVISADIRVGGHFTFGIPGVVTVTNRIVRCEPPRFLEWEFQSRREDEAAAVSGASPPTRVMWEIDPVEGGVMLRLTHGGFAPGSDELADVSTGWPEGIIRLVSLVG
jgi:uncharacterized protein YndB with AHSA1/START domain